jgi:regulator of protease activity HflC (stomatin/prohibitin superfamily)
MWRGAELVALLSIVLGLLGVHQIDEGYIGMYWVGGALQTRVSGPGLHFALPFITAIEQVQVSIQTDYVQNVPCGTSGGVMLTFDRIEVVNRLHKDRALETIRQFGTHYDRTLIFEKIHHVLNQFCSSRTLEQVYISQFDSLDEMLTQALQDDCNKLAPGVEIIATRVTKPRVPESIMRNYEMSQFAFLLLMLKFLVEIERTKLLIATEVQKVVEKDAETERLRATIEATYDAEVNAINMEMNLHQKKTTQEIHSIQNKMLLEATAARATADLMKIEAKAEANQLLLTPEYLEQKLVSAFTNSPKVIFTSSLPVLLNDMPSRKPKKEREAQLPA